MGDAARARPHQRWAGYDDLEAFCFFIRPLLADQYLRMRSDIARRFAGVSRSVLSRRLSAFSFTGRVIPACPDDPSALAKVARVDATSPDAARFAGIVGAISMPNISERSSLASTFAEAGAFRFCARAEPAFAIKSR